MNDNTTKLLEQLAAKLNTTVEHLWGILIYQARIQGIINIIIGAIAMVICINLFRLYYRLEKDDDYDAMFPKKPVTAIGVGVFLIISVACIISSITPFVNPEYWALEKILNKLGK